MTELKLDDFDAVTFDFYGTIVNWEPEVLAFLKNWLEDVELNDTQLLELYDRVRQPIQQVRPAWRYPEVLKRTLDQIAFELDRDLPQDLRDSFGSIAATHQPFPDSVVALQGLRDQGLVTGALSNIDEASFEASLKRIGINFDVIVTAQRVGSYKPDLPHFHAALSDLRAQGIEQDRVLHIAQSRFADVVPANQLGLACIWIDRPGHVFGRRGSGAEDAVPDMILPDLASLLAL
jgi:2-haloalkanoic acid dehalogenase type II